MTGVQLEAFALIEPSTGEMVKVGYPTRAIYSVEHQTSELMGGQKVVDGKVYTITCKGVFSTDDEQTLLGWAESSAKLEMAGYKGNMIFQAEGSITADTTDQGKILGISMSTPSLGGYADGIHTSSTSMSKNALALYDWVSQHGWETSSEDSAFNGNYLSVGTGDAIRRVFFPFEKKMFFNAAISGSGLISVSEQNALGEYMSTKEIGLGKGFELSEDCVYVELALSSDGKAFGFSKPMLSLTNNKIHEEYTV